MKKLKRVALFLLVIAATTSCSKEKRTERILHKKGGNWEVSSATWEKVVETDNGLTIDLGSGSNLGTFYFEENGNGSYNFTLTGTNFGQNFSWAAGDDSFSVYKIAQSFDLSGNITQIVISFNGTVQDKQNITLVGTHTEQIVSNSDLTVIVLTATLNLTKK